MNTNMEMQKKMADFIALLDIAILMAEDLNRQIDEWGRILEAKYPERLAA